MWLLAVKRGGLDSKMRGDSWDFENGYMMTTLCESL